MTPQEFYEYAVGKQWDIDHAYGVQCHDLAQLQCKLLDIPPIVIWCGNTGYAHDIWDRREYSGITEYYDIITDPQELRNGDMVIFPTTYAGTPLSHVCFFYEFNGIKYAFGQRQGGNREARLISTLDFSQMAGAFRAKAWAKEQEMNQGKYKGCDVSQFQIPNQSSISEYDFVIIRAGYTNNEDPYLDQWVKKCESEGKPYGFYWYSYATSEEWAEVEANMFVEVASRYNPTMGLWLDMEDADHYKQKKWGYLDQWLITAITEKFLTIVAKTGLYTGVYASQSWFGTLILSTEITQKYDKWVASWGTNSGNIERDTSHMGTMLQYTSKGGAGKNRDEDITYIELAVYDVKKTGQGKTQEQEEEPAQEVPQTADDTENEVKSLRAEIEKLKGIIDAIKKLLGL